MLISFFMRRERERKEFIERERERERIFLVIKPSIYLFWQ